MDIIVNMFKEYTLEFNRGMVEELNILCIE